MTKLRVLSLRQQEESVHPAQQIPRSALDDKAPCLSLRQLEESVHPTQQILPDRRQAGAPLWMTKLRVLSLRQLEESVHPAQKILRSALDDEAPYFVTPTAGGVCPSAPQHLPSEITI